MIGIIVPAHNEDALMEDCLTALERAAAHPGLCGETVKIVVCLDACTDRTAEIVQRRAVCAVVLDARNVGLARHAGATHALDAGARWLAFTDADSTVAPDWLVAQLALQADAVCGTVAVDNWGAYGERMQRHFQATYFDMDGHTHVHGANLGVSAAAYVACGGFSPVVTGEDVALVEALRAAQARVVWSSAPRVVTSARPGYRAPSGFGATLESIERLRQWVGIDLTVAA